MCFCYLQLCAGWKGSLCCLLSIIKDSLSPRLTPTAPLTDHTMSCVPMSSHSCLVFFLILTYTVCRIEFETWTKNVVMQITSLSAYLWAANIHRPPPVVRDCYTARNPDRLSKCHVFYTRMISGKTSLLQKNAELLKFFIQV